MRLTVLLDPRELRQWHLRLVRRLAARPETRVQVEWRDGTERLTSTVAVWAAIERALCRLPAKHMLAPALPADFTPFAKPETGPVDLVLDLGGTGARAGEPTWQLRFDGAHGTAAAIGALMRSRTPVVAIVDAHTGREIVSGRPGTEQGVILTDAFADVMARTATLVIAALDGTGTCYAGDRPAAEDVSVPAVAKFAVKSLKRHALSYVYRQLFYAPHWRTGWRFVDGPDVVDLRSHPASGWQDLPDDRIHFYVDPFPVEKDGRTYLFVEDFNHRSGYGVISVVEFNASGPIGVPRPVLDTGSHLSYPFVFEHDGEMWMVPESGSAGTVDLYRAEQFPYRWSKEATLLAGMVVSDATLFEHAGRWWMFATVQDDGGCYSDALHIWSAPEPRGPWTPHKRNPVLVDAGTARPAGRIVRRDGKLIRPIQDCRNGYGTALGLAEITRLDDDAFEQRVDAVLRPGPLWPGRRIHTLNRAGRLECIDGSAWSSKLLERLQRGRAAPSSESKLGRLRERAADRAG